MIIDPAILVPINIGEMAILRESKVISTVLGSCVSVCLYSGAQRAGGMNHFALAHRLQASSGGGPFHYGEEAIPALIEGLARLTGEKPHTFVAKIAGGAFGLSGNSNQVGKENIELTQRLLSQHRIPIIGSSVGGGSGRKVLFYPDSGRLRISMLADRIAG